MKSDELKTAYPIMLVHGAGFRDLKIPLYWGRIPTALKKGGAELYYGGQDSWGTVETNAGMLAERINEVLAFTGSEKINLICHSKGGLDARAAARLPSLEGKIASIICIATPHGGSKTVDRLLTLPKRLFNIAGFIVDRWIRLVGDVHPDFSQVCREFSTEHMRKFNEETQDIDGIFYRSFACVQKNAFADFSLWISYLIVKRYDGENDGLVGVWSALRGDSAETVTPQGRRGISHLDAVDFRRKAPYGKNSFDSTALYIGIVKELKERGL